MPKAELGQRLFEDGNPNPEFALLGTVNWMRALAILTQDANFNRAVATIVRGGNWKREDRQSLQDLAFEKLFLAQSYLAALRSLTSVENPYDIARMAIVSWYYCIYFSSQAMLAITGHHVPDEHQKTARVWLNQLVIGPSKPLIAYPFNLNVTSLVKATADKECEQQRRDTGQDVNTTPLTLDQAHDAHVSYLKGSSGFYREKEEDRVRASRAFRDAQYNDFRKKGAREMRDSALCKRGVGFLDMAFRYRGKANYRDAIFLSYGKHSTQTQMSRFVKDTHVVASTYYAMSRAWVSCRVLIDDWNHFLDDLRVNSRLTAAT